MHGALANSFRKLGRRNSGFVINYFLARDLSSGDKIAVILRERFHCSGQVPTKNFQVGDRELAIAALVLIKKNASPVRFIVLAVARLRENTMLG